MGCSIGCMRCLSMCQVCKLCLMLLSSVGLVAEKRQPWVYLKVLSFSLWMKCRQILIPVNAVLSLMLIMVEELIRCSEQTQ